MTGENPQHQTDDSVVEKAVLYMRTSIASDTVHGGAFVNQQRSALTRYASVAGFDVIAEHCDTADDCGKPAETRGGFAALLEDVDGNDASIVLIKDVSCLASSSELREQGTSLLRERGVRLITADGQELTSAKDADQERIWLLIAWLVDVEKSRGNAMAA